jgi:acyl-CoA reductase-like NAD-dependent aldehyde dehydrogenase
VIDEAPFPLASGKNAHQSRITAMSTLSIPKTYKIYLNGAFIRSESGRTFAVTDSGGAFLANIPLSSRKDMRNAVVAARAALAKWAGATAFLRGQILYRAAEMLDSRSAEFVALLARHGLKTAQAQREVATAVADLVCYAGWADKFQAVFSTVNPVASPHFNFTALEPTGVVAVFAPEQEPLVGLLRAVLPVLTGGNTAVVFVSSKYSAVALTLAEVLHHSDFPAGSIALLSASRAEILEPVAGHKDINAIAAYGLSPEQQKTLELLGADNVKRVRCKQSPGAPNPYDILDFQECKTTWHPVEVSFAGGSAY